LVTEGGPQSDPEAAEGEPGSPPAVPHFYENGGRNLVIPYAEQGLPKPEVFIKEDVKSVWVKFPDRAMQLIHTLGGCPARARCVRREGKQRIVLDLFEDN
jgi:hypothetical protein